MAQTKSLRILHIVHQYPPDFIGGTELYTKQLAQQQVNAGYASAVFAPTSVLSSPKKKISLGGVVEYRPYLNERKALQVFTSTFTNIALLKSFELAVQDFKPHLVHIQHLMGLPVKIVDVLASADIPFIITLHDYWYICANAQLLTNFDQTLCSGPDKYFNCGRCALVRAGLPRIQLISPAVSPVMAWRNHAARKALSQGHRIIAPSNFIRSIYLEFFEIVEKTEVIPFGIEKPEIEFKKHRQHTDQLNIVYIGGISRQKGVHVLIEAVNKMPAEDVQLRVYGNTQAFPEYSAELQALIAHPGIELAGAIDRQELWKTLSQSDVIVIPTLWYEGSPAVVREAFTAEVPIVASRIGALKESVSDGQDGFLFEPGDINALHAVLMKLYRNPDILTNLRAGIQPVRTIEDHVRSVEDIYWRVLEES